MARKRGLMLALVLLGVVAALILGLVIAKNNGLLYDPVQISQHLKVASVSLEVDVDPEINRQKLISFVKTIEQTHPDTEVILFGELILGWYSKKPINADYQRSIAETIPGYTTNLMSKLAKEYGIYLSFGMAEAQDENLYNSQILIDPKGEILTVHRKFYLQGASAFQPGKFPVTIVKIKGIKTAMIICSDIQDPAVRSELVKEQPNLILGSLANPTDPGWFISGMLAKMFDTWIITANRYGADDTFFFDGQMIVSDPLGDLRIKTKGQEQVIITEIGFSEDRSPIQKFFRRVYAGLSLVLHFIKGFAIPFMAR